MRKIAFFLAVAILAAEETKSAKILGLFPHTGKSHQMVFDPLLRTLAERGHRLTVVSFFPLKDPPVNYTSVSLEGLAPIGLETIDLLSFDTQSRIRTILGIEKINKQFAGLQLIADIALTVCSKIVDFKPLAEVLQKSYDVILMENFNSDCMLGLAHVYGLKAPIVSLLSTSMMPWCPDRIGVTDNPSYIPILRSDISSKFTFLQKLQNTVMNVCHKLWYRYTIQLKEKAILENHFNRRIPDLQDLGKNVSAMLINTFHSLNGVRPLLPGVIEVGGMNLYHKPETIPQMVRHYI